jgi:hypothetical protein
MPARAAARASALGSRSAALRAASSAAVLLLPSPLAPATAPPYQRRSVASAGLA